MQFENNTSAFGDVLNEVASMARSKRSSLPHRTWSERYKDLDINTALGYLVALGRRESGTGYFHLGSENAPAYQKALAWLLALPHPEINDPMKGLIVTGSTGTGKTLLVRLLWMLAKGIDLHRPFWDGVSSKAKMEPLLWNYNAHVCDHVSSYIESPDASFSALRYRVLHIGDLGAEPESFSRYGTRGSIADLICQRSDLGYRDAPMIITTNLTWDEIHRLYGDRASSRLRNDLIEVQLTGTDYRTTNNT